MECRERGYGAGMPYDWTSQSAVMTLTLKRQKIECVSQLSIRRSRSLTDGYGNPRRPEVRLTFLRYCSYSQGTIASRSYRKPPTQADKIGTVGMYMETLL